VASFVAVAALLLFAGPAGAAVRFASPAGAGANPCNPTACSLKVAIEGAQDGDEVVVGPGLYAQPTTISVTKAIIVGGSVEMTQPTVAMKGVPFEVKNAGAIVHDLKFTLTQESMATPFVLVAGSAERIVADPAGLGAGGCFLEAGTLSDSLCIGGLTVFAGEPGNYKVVVANVTADPILLGNGAGANVDAYVVNSVALPASGLGSFKEGLLIDSGAGGSVSAVIRNSNFNAVATSLSTGKSFTVTPAGTNGNQTTPPQFVDPVHGDFRPLPTSPTIDAGVAEPVIGAFDVFGLPRVQPRCLGGTPIPDIGAYEFQPTEACPAKPEPPGGGGVTVVPVVKKKLLIGKARLKLNRTKGTGLLTFKAPGPGKASVSGKGVVVAAAAVKKAGKVSLPVRAKGRQARRLADAGRVKLGVLITERLADGTRLKRYVPVELKLRLPA
jgi:hypothetical protein